MKIRMVVKVSCRCEDSEKVRGTAFFKKQFHAERKV